MKIPFDIKYRPQIESGEYKVETRDGRPVRIVCWDRISKEGADNDLNLCVLVPEEEWEAVYYYHQSGNKWAPDKAYDLFIIIPEPELIEFEQALETFLMNADASEQTFHENVKKYADKLLKLAKKEALKDLPRWKRADRDIISNTIDFATQYMHDGGDHADWVEVIVTNIIHKGEKYLEISDFQKFPGFND